MSTFWKEQFNPKAHHNQMWGPGCEVPEYSASHIDPKWVYFVRVCSFTFEFHSISQITKCLEYYSQKIHQSSIIPSKMLITGAFGGDHGETQRWFERLPQRLLEESKRIKVVKALEKSLNVFI